MANKIEYRITGIFRCDLDENKRHVVDWNRKWSLAEAQGRLKELQNQAKREMEHKNRTPVKAGMLSVTTEYESKYDLLDLRIESREVTPWGVV